MRDDVPVGTLLSRYRRARRLTQEVLAERAELSERTIRNLERGTDRRPQRATIDALVRALDLDHADRRRFEAAVTAAADRACPVLPDPVAGVPPDPSPHFVGREAQLDEVGCRLRESRRVAIDGLGGIGKTQLALRYIDRNGDQYADGVFWLRADMESNLLGDLASLAWHLQLPEREEPEQARRIAAALRWLREHPRWLLVLDNLEPPVEEAARRLTPSGRVGHVLATSRTPAWPVRVRLEPLALDDATSFLLRRTASSDVRAAGAIAELLGGLPLALEQAGAYVDVNGRDLASYAELLRTRLVELMGEGKPAGYPHALATTWSLSFERVEDESRAAADLLRLCSVVAADDLPATALAAGAHRLPEPLRAAAGDEVEFDRAVAHLRRYSLVERHGDGLSVHRLVQAVVRASLPAERREAWLVAAIDALHAAFPEEPEQRSERWPLCSRLLPHVLAVEGLAEGPTAEQTGFADLLQRAGGYLRLRGEYQMARRLYERALGISERVRGADHPDTATSISDLAGLLREQGEFDAARRLHERGLAIRERTLGPDHPDVAGSLNNLGCLLNDLGDYDAAREVLERAVAIRERTLGADHARTATSLNNLALALMAQGKLDAAGPLFRRALAIREGVQGADHPLTAQSMGNLGHWLRLTGDAVAARPLLERGASTLERVLGGRHPETAWCQYKLAAALQDLGEPDAACSLLESAVAAMEAALGPGHHRTVESARALAELREPGAGL
jgi:tetratricopeptide (TPR) repeat protein/transcriptional regulator with XRE-family HTH domain